MNWMFWMNQISQDLSLMWVSDLYPIWQYLHLPSTQPPRQISTLTTALILQWRHNERHGVSNYQPHDSSLIRLFRRISRKTSKLRATGFCEGNSPVTGEFPAQKANDAENISIWWRHHKPSIWEMRQTRLVVLATRSRHIQNSSGQYLVRLKIFAAKLLGVGNQLI